MLIIQMILRFVATRYGILRWLYVKICRPNSVEYAGHLAKWGGLHAIGNACSINTAAIITDPAYVRLGNNVTLSDCTLLGHDGVIRVLNIAYGRKLDSVGKIEIGDNCFIGHQAIIMPNTSIGPNSIVAAGSVVTTDVPEGIIVGGNPARPIGTTKDLLARLEQRTRDYPWRHLIEKRSGSWDPVLEPELLAMRIKYFFAD